MLCVGATAGRAAARAGSVNQWLIIGCSGQIFARPSAIKQIPVSLQGNHRLLLLLLLQSVPKVVISVLLHRERYLSVDLMLVLLLQLLAQESTTFSGGSLAVAVVLVVGKCERCIQMPGAGSISGKPETLQHTFICIRISIRIHILSITFVVVVVARATFVAKRSHMVLVVCGLQQTLRLLARRQTLVIEIWQTEVGGGGGGSVRSIEE